ncbi:hypothetical protein JXM83_01750 [Candidatus Woesearchaeota archaeon]|nr:hypothetical protein [Candidatus Woesearchaeota archaeon]
MKTVLMYYDENGWYAREISSLIIFSGVRSDPEPDYDYAITPCVPANDSCDVLVGRFDSFSPLRKIVLYDAKFKIDDFGVDSFSAGAFLRLIDSDSTLEELLETIKCGSVSAFKDRDSNLGGFSINYDEYDSQFAMLEQYKLDERACEEFIGIPVCETIDDLAS